MAPICEYLTWVCSQAGQGTPLITERFRGFKSRHAHWTHKQCGSIEFMSFRESDVHRDESGRFSDASGSPPEVSLSVETEDPTAQSCSECKSVKSLDDFPRDPRGGYRRKCKTCRNRYMRGYYQRPEVNSTHRERVQKNPNRALHQKRAEARRYGFDSIEAYDDFISSQPVICPICMDKPSVVTDHDHDTGSARGRLCSNCNVALGFMADDPERLVRAAEYLRNAASVRPGT